ncbi:A/G-specific adenine glycosylase [Stenoxybacter acetivorans]|uniref:A/G-specific adenine glycosylase n=1 Tax=Stenoxybacter acetivorans TaxID=422441 RepID=UPI0005647402|nr:A/G-specific adenine glycosylase [Stenoxybacter acetivorans]
MTSNKTENTTWFAENLIAWQRQYGRHDLPWQSSDPYRVWLSEIMLQQTQVSTVRDYYPRFIAAFPTVQALADADEDAVLSLWQGLGYYSRARHLHNAAKQVVNDFGGVFPQTRIQLETLRGVGRSTAAAIAAFAFNKRETILDGNVKRVLCRVFALDGDLNDKTFTDQLWALAEKLLPENETDMSAYTQGLMDLGATLCKRNKPECAVCPMINHCLAYRHEQQAQLPRKKTATPVQEVFWYWLIIRRGDGAVWLEKRPAKGIWGGLWCVPCVDGFQAALDYGALFGVAAEEWQEMPPFKHRLTHRLLHITPLLVAVDAVPSLSISGQWLTAASWTDLGLPKPLAAYLSKITGKNNGLA